MNIKILSATLLTTTILLSACGENKSVEKEEPKKESVKKDTKPKFNEKEFALVDSKKFETKGYKHEAKLKITDAEVVSVEDNELGMQQATLTTFDKNKVPTGIYTAINYSDKEWKAKDKITVFGTYDLKHEDPTNEPTIDVQLTK